LSRDTFVRILLYTHNSYDLHHNASHPRTPQVDWLSNPESKNKQVDLKSGLGRDEILVPKKGQVILNSFGDVAIAESEGSHLGPGEQCNYLRGRLSYMCVVVYLFVRGSLD
jgi:hypothetical protein